VDEAGNPQRYSGKPFSVSAFRYSRDGKSRTNISPNILFEDASSIKLSTQGKRVLSEVQDFLRMRFTSPVEIVVYELDEKFALARANEIEKNLSSSLEYAEARIKVSGVSLKGKKGYRHVEIISK
jgi:hypothetical protein